MPVAPKPDTTGIEIRFDLSGAARLPWKSWLLLIAAGIAAFRPVTVAWNSNPSYSFGWLIPFVSIYLFYERWPTRPVRQPPELSFRSLNLLLAWGLPFSLLRLAAETDPDWRFILWLLVGFYVVGLLTWLWMYGGLVWVRHFAFPVCFLLISLPWMIQIERPLTEALMGLNTWLVTGLLQKLGIAAQAAGNIIQLPHCQLGVEEACSGILSLQSTFMLACLLGEIYRLSVRRRLELILLSIGLALLGNFGRTFFLALLAFFSGTSSVLFWHDTAGFLVLAFTASATWMTCVWLKKKMGPQVAPVMHESRREILPTENTARHLAVGLFIIALVSEAGTQAWFGWRESGITHNQEWIAQFPVSEEFKPMALSDITLNMLRCDAYKTGRWRDARGWDWTAFWFQYKPKASNRYVLGWHNPDICLPTVGLRKTADYPVFETKTNGIDFYVHPTVFAEQDISIYVFWVIYMNDGDLPRSGELESNFASYQTKIGSHLRDIWQGYRGMGVETLELVAVGPENYDLAKAGFLARLKEIAIPIASTQGLAAAASK
jgi:exosortase